MKHQVLGKVVRRAIFRVYQTCLLPIAKPLKGQGARPSHQGTSFQPLSNQSGQIVVEYILLMVASVGFAVVVSNSFVGRNPESPGLVIAAWSQISNAIGADIID